LNKNGGVSVIPFFLFTLITLLLDQFSKMIVQKFLTEGATIPVWPPFFYLTYVHNPGIAFGLFPNQGTLLAVMVVMVIIAAAAVHILLTQSHPMIKVGLGLLLGGALGNIIDRLRIGQVIDFLDFRFWPVFNLADVAIVCGALLFFVALGQKPKTDPSGRHKGAEAQRHKGK
jgi:signal peptidase II